MTRVSAFIEDLIEDADGWSPYSLSVYLFHRVKVKVRAKNFHLHIRLFPLVCDFSDLTLLVLIKVEDMI